MTDEPEKIEADETSFRKWLEAQRPPFGWFMALSSLEQTALADIGADYVVECARVHGDAWLECVGTAAGGAEPQPMTEEDLVRHIAQNAHQGANGNTPLTAEDLASALERREQRRQAEAEAAPPPATLAGKPREDDQG